MGKINSVRVRRKSDKSEHTMTVKAWNDLKNNKDERDEPVFTVLGYFVTENNTETYFEGDPNHHTQQIEERKSVAVHVGSSVVGEAVPTITFNDSIGDYLGESATFSSGQDKVKVNYTSEAEPKPEPEPAPKRKGRQAAQPKVKEVGNEG